MLIFSNGRAEWRLSERLFLDGEGDIVQDSSPSCSAVCNIVTKTYNRNGKNDGGYSINNSYEVYFDMSSVEEGFNPTNVKLWHENRGYLGEFTVQRVEYYSITKTICLWV